MPWYLEDANPTPGDEGDDSNDVDPQQLISPSEMGHPTWSLNGPASAHLEAEGMQPQLQICDNQQAPSFGITIPPGFGFPGDLQEYPALHLDPYQQSVNSSYASGIGFQTHSLPIPENTQFGDVYANNVQSLSWVTGQLGLLGSDSLGNLEEPPSVQAAHGRVEHLTPLTCVVCKTAFRTNTELFKHGKDIGHHPYACSCGETFSRLYTITRHLGSRAATSGTSRIGARYQCPLCTKYDGERGFDRRDHLRQHLRVCHKIDKRGIEFVIGAMRSTADIVAQNVIMPPID